jgi:hypothetical protein
MLEERKLGVKRRIKESKKEERKGSMNVKFL